jgi:hypothetical protein
MTDPVVAKRARAQLALELHRGDGGFLGKKRPDEKSARFSD